jgi:intracellular multiplication protein IcmC
MIFMRKYYLRVIIFIAAVLASFPLAVYAQGTNGVAPPTPPAPTNTVSMDASQMLVSLSSNYPAVWQMLTGLCYIIASILTIRGVYYLKAYGELRTMTATQSSIKVPVIYFVVASALFFIPSAFATINQTIFGSTSPLSYTQLSTSMSPVVLAALVGLIQIVGLVSFIRGWMILVANAQQSSGQATFGRALTHIVGGVLAINVLGLANVIWGSFGFGSFT